MRAELQLALDHIRLLDVMFTTGRTVPPSPPGLELVSLPTNLDRVTVLTANMQGDETENLPNVYKQLCKTVQLHHVDIVALQEDGGGGEDDEHGSSSLKEWCPFVHRFDILEDGYSNSVFSKWPIQSSGPTWVKTNNIIVHNIHMPDEPDTNTQVKCDLRQPPYGSVGSRCVSNAAQAVGQCLLGRGHALSLLLSNIQQHPGLPEIIMGDFNEPSVADTGIPTPSSILLTHLGFQDAALAFSDEQQAQPTWPTPAFYKEWDPMRIDYIYVATSTTIASKLQRIDIGSDHYALLTSIIHHDSSSPPPPPPPPILPLPPLLNTPALSRHIPASIAITPQTYHPTSMAVSQRRRQADPSPLPPFIVSPPVLTLNKSPQIERRRPPGLTATTTTTMTPQVYRTIPAASQHRQQPTSLLMNDKSPPIQRRQGADKRSRRQLVFKTDDYDTIRCSSCTIAYMWSNDQRDKIPNQPVIVWVGGGGSDRTAFRRFQTPFFDRTAFASLTFDNRGIGNTICHKNEEEWTLQDFANDTIELVENVCKNNAVTFIGSSLGAAIIQQILLTKPQIVQRAILMGSGAWNTGWGDFYQRAELQLTNTDLPVDFQIAHQASMLYPAQALGDRLLWPRLQRLLREWVESGQASNTVQTQWSASVSYDQRSSFQQQNAPFACPVHVISFEQDMEAPVQDGEELARLMQATSFHIVPKAGHASWYGHLHDKINQLLLDLLLNDAKK